MFSVTSVTIVLGLVALFIFLFPGALNASSVRESDVSNALGQDVTDNFDPNVLRWADEVRTASDAVGWEFPAIALATVQDESLGDPDAVGKAGEQGLMQIKDAAAFDVANAFEFGPGQAVRKPPSLNVKIGVAFLELQRRRWDRRGTEWLLFDTLRAYRTGFRKSTNDLAAGSADAIDRLRLAGRSDLIPPRGSSRRRG